MRRFVLVALVGVLALGAACSGSPGSATQGASVTTTSEPVLRAAEVTTTTEVPTTTTTEAPTTTTTTGPPPKAHFTTTVRAIRANAAEIDSLHVVGLTGASLRDTAASLERDDSGTGGIARQVCTGLTGGLSPADVVALDAMTTWGFRTRRLVQALNALDSAIGRLYIRDLQDSFTNICPEHVGAAAQVIDLLELTNPN
jgi:hypothetical protein